MRTFVYIFCIALIGCASSEKSAAPITPEPPALEADSPQYQEEIRIEIRRNLTLVKKCYEGAYKAKPNLGGKVTMGFEIKRSGQVANIKVKNNNFSVGTESSQLESCLVGVFSELRFPKFQSAAETIQMTYPITFKSTQK